MTGRLFNCFWLTLIVIIVVEAAPSRSKSKNSGPQLFYNQKQKGETNVQLHLKDFQIILLGDSDGGDYEYAYDYADFTVKPSSSRPSSSTEQSTSSTTSRPPTSPPSTSTVPPSSTTKPPYSFSTLKPLTTTSTTIKPIQHQNGVNSSKPSAQVPVTPQKTLTEDSNSAENAIVSSDATSLIKDMQPGILASEQTQVNGSTQDPTIMSMTPGKIKVQIMGEPSEVPSTTQVHIVPGEDLGESEGAPMDDVLKRCASGFTRDKKGRCRRTRRPGVQSQLPFGFSRFASNLASRLRLSPSQTALDSSELP